MSPEKPEPVTVAVAAQRLCKRPGTIRSWATRYHARKHGTFKNRTVYDWHDLATIARQIHLGLPVPPSPEERDVIRAGVQSAA